MHKEADGSGWVGLSQCCAHGAVSTVLPPSTTSCTLCLACPAGREAPREAAEECTLCRAGGSCDRLPSWALHGLE